MEKMWGRKPLLGVCSGILGVWLLAGVRGGQPLSAEEKARPAAKADLPADLDRVPGDAVFFVSVRVADRTVKNDATFATDADL